MSYIRLIFILFNPFKIHFEDYSPPFKRTSAQKYFRAKTTFDVVINYPKIAAKNYVSGGTIPDPEWDLGDLYSTRNLNSLPNDFPMFIFNKRNNCLPLNNRVNAYIAEMDSACTFCRM
jgi:hypothetical protein